MYLITRHLPFINSTLYRFFVLFCCCFLMLGLFNKSLQAQEESSVEEEDTYIPPLARLGVKFGTNLTRVDSRPSFQQGGKLGLQLGLVWRIPTTYERFTGRVEFLFTQKGYRTQQLSLLGFEYTEHFRSNYLELPLLLQMNYGRTQRAFFTFGPYVGYWLKAKYVNKGNNLKETIPYIFDANSNRIEAGLQIGTGSQFELDSGHVFIVEGRYGLGLTNVFKNLPPNSRFQNRGISLSIAYLFLGR